jgi:hypothetical protein
MFTGVYWTEDRVSHHKAGWYDRAPRHNEPGNPVIRHLPNPADAAQVERDAAEALGVPAAGQPGDPDEAEIARLKRRLAELEAKRQNRT